MNTRFAAAGLLLFGAIASAVATPPNFIARYDYLPENGANNVSLGHLNGDGRLDIFHVDNFGYITVYINLGRGRFKPGPVTKAVPSGSYGAMAVADLNNDGIDDVVLSATSHFYSMLGIGDGTFATATNVVIPGPGVTPNKITLADISGDGKIDVIGALNEGGAAVALNLGNGSFATPTTYASTGQCWTPAVANLNGDSLPDLVLTCNGGVISFLGTGSGALQMLPKLEFANGANGLAFGDLNHDGKLDAVISYVTLQGNQTLFGNGDGTFQLGPSNIGTSQAGAVALADLDHDGNLDLLMAGQLGYIALLRGNPDGSFQAPSFLDAGYGNSSLVAGHLRDIDHWDIVSPGKLSNTVSVLLQQTNPFSYNEGIAINLTYPPGPIAKGDFNGDGRPDVAVAGASTFQIFWGTGRTLAGLVAGQTSTLSGTVYAMTGGDFNKDGKSDLAFAVGFPTSIVVLLGRGNGAFQGSGSVPVERPGQILSGDFNGDGKPDIVLDNGYVLYGSGTGSFTQPKQFAAEPYATGNMALAVADFNHDGKDDVALGEPFNINDSVAISLGSVQGLTRTFQVIPEHNFGPYSLGSGDLNGDGDPDLIVASRLHKSIFLGNGDGTFQEAPQIDGAKSDVKQVQVGDFNGDGKVDFFLTYPTAECVAFYLGNGDGTFAPVQGYGMRFEPNYMVSGRFQTAVSADTLIVSDAGGSLQLLNQIPQAAIAGDDFPPSPR